jgi:hypothetical protein
MRITDIDKILDAIKSNTYTFEQFTQYMIKKISAKLGRSLTYPIGKKRVLEQINALYGELDKVKETKWEAEIRRYCRFWKS